MLKWCLFLTLVALAIIMTFGLVLMMEWPVWMGIVLLVGAVGFLLGLFVLRKIWRKRREQHFVEKVIEQDNAYVESLSGPDKARSREVQDRWKEAVDTLRKSHLKQQGNPLYVLPWYLVIGESGSGKTTAIQSARLSSPFAQMTQTSGISGTRNCDWWFFEQAIIIDTAGRYAVPVDEGRDKEEWDRFLSQLVRFRRKEPLNGLVVTIATDKLIDSDPESLENDGREIRRRIDELMYGLGARFPIFLLVTKCDLIQGMTQFCNRVPEKSLDQAMGKINEHLEQDVGSFCDQSFRAMGDRLRELRLLLLDKTRADEVDPGLLLFPEELESLKPGLDAFVKGTFRENPFQETPILRGLYFSSGRQEGSPYSHFLKGLGLIEERDVLPGTSKGLFLRDFFAEILPKDRQLYGRTRAAQKWSRTMRNLGVTAWMFLVFAICGVLSFSFVMNLNTIGDFRKEFSKPPVLEGELIPDIGKMARFRNAILQLEEQNRKWRWMPRMGLNQSLEEERFLKNRYTDQLHKMFLDRFDGQMASRIAGFTPQTPALMVGKHALHLTRRINLLRNRLNGAGYDTLRTAPQPVYAPVLFKAGNKRTPEEVDRQFHELMLHYLAWQPDREILNNELNRLMAQLKHLLTRSRRELSWLIAVVDNDPVLSAVRLSDFWGPGPSDEKLEISPAYTTRGKERTATYIEEIQTALTESIIIENQKEAFYDAYETKYLHSWESFCLKFPMGWNRLEGEVEWRRFARIMGTDNGPYFALLSRMAAELIHWADSPKAPVWVKQVHAFQGIRAEAVKEKDKDEDEENGIQSEIGTLAKRVVTRRSTTAGRVASYAGEFEGGGDVVDPEASVAELVRYRDALKQLNAVVGDRETLFDQTVKTFQGKDANFRVAFEAFHAFERAMGDPKIDKNLLFPLVRGPFDFLWEFARRESACALQKRWEDRVLWEVKKTSDKMNLLKLLFDSRDGHVTKFIEKDELAAPFIRRSLRQDYMPKQIYGTSLWFRKDFFTFLGKGTEARRRFDELEAKKAPEIQTEKPERPALKSEYLVKVRGLPTDVNRDALIKPHATRLEVQCVDKTSQLINLQYPIQKTFAWSPRNCGDVVFKIEIGSHVLTRRYRGDKAFPAFLQDFFSGRTFKPQDFPEFSDQLQALQIEYIRVNYQFSGDVEEAIELLTPPKPPPSPLPEPVLDVTLPQVIVKCWD